MNEIKCPNCGTIFQINETDYDKIVKQIKNQEYDKEIKELENRYKKDKEQELEIILNKNIVKILVRRMKRYLI